MVYFFIETDNWEKLRKTGAAKRRIDRNLSKYPPPITNVKKLLGFIASRVIETWLLLAVLKVPIGGDGSNIQYFQGFVGGAAI